jgi:hypothetical protein
VAVLNINKNISSYYNFAKLFSYNATYNFCVGARGLGKTYGAKKKAIKDALKDGSEFIYLRRYKEEMVTAKEAFFADIAHEFPKYDLEVKGAFAFAAPITSRDTKKREWTKIGYFIALSTAQKIKSVPFPKVRTIIFDEFILEPGPIRYLPSEATVFNNFYSSIDRYKDKTKVLFIANSVSIMNPYFIEYEIRPDEEGEFVIKADGFICAHFPNADNFKSEVYETRFGKFIKESDYAQYAVGNKFSDDHDSLLELKDSKARAMFILETDKGQFSVWLNIFSDQYYIQSKLPKGVPMFTLIPSKMSKEKVLLTLSDRNIAYLRTAFRQGNVNFDKPTTRNIFAEIFK